MRSIPERESIPGRRVDSCTLRSKLPLWPSVYNIKRDLVHELFREDTLRDVIPMFLSMYGGDSLLFFGEFAEMLSEEGSQQGCPLGGLLFVLSIATIVEDIAREFPTVTVVGLADDYRR